MPLMFGVHHQRINESQTEHDPKRRVREKEEEREEIREVEKTGQRRHDVPSRVRKNFRIGSGAFDIQRINVHLVAQIKEGAPVLIADVAGERKFHRQCAKKNGRPLSGTAVTLIKQPENSSGNGSAAAADFERDRRRKQERDRNHVRDFRHRCEIQGEGDAVVKIVAIGIESEGDISAMREILLQRGQLRGGKGVGVVQWVVGETFVLQECVGRAVRNQPMRVAVETRTDEVVGEIGDW